MGEIRCITSKLPPNTACTDTYFQQFKTNLFQGIRIIAIPALVASIIILLYLSTGFDQAMWDVDFIGGIIISLLYVVPFLFSSFWGLIIISVIISSHKQLPNLTVFILGALIGIVILVIGNYISSVFGLGNDEFTSLLSVSTVFLLAYAGQKMNRHANLDSSLELELRGVLWMVLITFIGTLAFALIRYKENIYWGSLYIYSYLGKVLLISLPIAVSIGIMIGFIIKKTQKPA